MSEIVFLISDKKFPHGDAGGNRLEYLAKCLLLEKIQPVIISLGKNLDEDMLSNYYSKDGILYMNYPCSHGFWSNYITSGYYVSRIFRELAKEIGIPSNVVIYSSNPIFITIIRLFLPSKIRILYDVVEWDDVHSFKKGYLNPRFWLNKWCFSGIYPSGDGIIAISKNIEKHFSNLGIKTIVFPICLDPNAFRHEYDYRKDADILKLIYPGNPENKDDIEKVLLSIINIDRETRKKIILHFTAVSKERIKNIMGRNSSILDKLSDNIVFHPWLNYDELLQLYYSVDALILFRFDNQVCRSNFPSKVPELLSCGTFIIANNCGDFYEYLSEGEDTILIKDNTIEGCMKALLAGVALLPERKKELSKNSINTAKNKFSYMLFSQKIAEFIKNE